MARLVYGVATNSEGRYRTVIDGKRTKAYNAWKGILKRSYCPKFQIKQPTYIGCSVHNDWLEYQEFAEWHASHEYSDKDYQLDKDLLVPNNKVYAPDKVCFVPQELNSLLLDNRAIRGEYPQGVCFHKPLGKFLARLKVNGKQKHLGCFDCPQEAHQAYVVAKEAHVKVKAQEWRGRIDERVYEALIAWRLTE